MVCIYCTQTTQVTNSRHQKRLNQIWRRRLCTACGTTFTTHETPDFDSSIMVSGSSRGLTPFSRDKLFLSIYESCRHRPSAISNATALTQTVMSHLKDHIVSGLLDRDVIAAVTQATLERFNKTVGTMYTAYHPKSDNVD